MTLAFRVCFAALLFGGLLSSQTPVRTDIERPSAEEILQYTWSGKLVDARCKKVHIDEPCPVASSTLAFGIVGDGGVILPFDENGNELAREALTVDGRAGNVEATVVGIREGGLLKVMSLEITP